MIYFNDDYFSWGVAKWRLFFDDFLGWVPLFVAWPIFLGDSLGFYWFGIWIVITS